jgi:hypothetical protein
MELNEFITNVLVEIATGVKNANKNLGIGAFAIEAYRREKETGYIAFDIAVRTSEASGKDAKGGIQVLNLGIGGKLEKTSTLENANRIKFYILPSSNIG